MTKRKTKMTPADEGIAAARRDARERLERAKWETVGEIGVDAGRVIVGDPCYFAAPDASNAFESLDELWGQVGERLVAPLAFKHGGHGMAVVVSSGLGDGVYPVEVRRAKNGRIAELRVKFMEEE